MDSRAKGGGRMFGEMIGGQKRAYIGWLIWEMYETGANSHKQRRRYT